jgi:hypothetical protein
VIVVTGAVALVSTAPALASYECSNGHYEFYKSDPVQRWWTVSSGSGVITASGQGMGWTQAFVECRDSNWAPYQFTLKAASTGKFLTVDYNDNNTVKANRTSEGGRELFTVEFLYWTGANLGTPVYAVRHVESGNYLGVGAVGAPVRASSTTIGWHQAFAHDH